VDIRVFYKKEGATGPKAPAFPTKRGLMLSLDQARKLNEALTLILVDHENGKYEAVGATYL